MSKIIASTITFILGASVVAVGSYISLDPQANVVNLNFEKESIERTTTSSEFFYTTLEQSTTTSEYKVVRPKHTVTIDNIGYLMCLDGVFETGTTTYDGDKEIFTPYSKEEQEVFCLAKQQKQLDLNEKWFLEGETGRVKMLKYK